MGFLSVIVSFAIIILLAALEIFLSTRRSKWPGLVLVILVAAVAIGINLSITLTANSYEEETLAMKDGNGNQFELIVRYDKQGEIVDFSELYVDDKNGERVAKVELWLEGGKLMGETEQVLYQDALDELTEGLVLDGVSWSRDDLEEKMVRVQDGSYIGVGNWALSTLLVVVPILPVYMVGRLTVRAKRRKKELRKLQVESL